jgi:F-type H+-transporting ATPase subunit epsilon
MNLSIRTPSQTLFEGEVTDVTIPTHIGSITILPGHMPLASVVQAGIIQCTPVDQSLVHNKTFVFDQKQLSIAIGSGMLYVDGETILVLGTAGSTGTDQTHEELKKDEKKLADKIETLRQDGSLAELEEAIVEMDAIKADIKLSKINQA